MTSPLTDQQLDEYEALIQRTTPLGAATASPGMAATLLAEIRRQRDEADEHQAEKAKLIRWHGEDEATFAEMRGTIGRLRTEKRELGELAARRESELIALRPRVATAHGQAIAWAADVVDEKLSAEPDHNRASALYELLLHLRGELRCTCARSAGLHEKCCRRYVPGHELISRHNALARYRAERTNQPALSGAADAAVSASRTGEAPEPQDASERPSTALLRDAASYLSALHGSVARHDNLAANLGCAGCELRDKIRAQLATPAVPTAAAGDTRNRT